MLDRDSPTPLYRQIEEVIRDLINSGHWPRHYKLKAEDELALEFGVSRGTVRQALQSLVEEGLLTQIQGKGTFVAASTRDLPLAQRLVTMHEVLAATGEEFTTEVLNREVVQGDENIRTLLSLPSEGKLLYLRRRLVVEKEPIVVMENHVPLALCPKLTEIDFSRVPLFEAIEKDCGLEIGWGQRNFAAMVAGEKAGLLDADPNEPVLYLEQISYLTDGVPIEYSEVWVRGQKLRLTTILSRRVPDRPYRQNGERGV
ncbi:MAG: GntR family transcriptional regulator [Rubrobacteraceae bacterium]|nr:GntR family transcriptional regulator [Rubrobacteraceae bacterium]